jgi:hypothetical protein
LKWRDGRGQRRANLLPRVGLARPHESTELNSDRLYRMTDSTGIFQHARFTAPNHSRDGLHADRGNENQESTLAFLMSLAEMRLTENTANGVQGAYLAASVAQ